MGGSALNYLFQILAGRSLPVIEYGSLTILFSIMAIAAVPTSMLSMFVSRNVTIYRCDDSGKWLHVLKKIFLFIVAFAFVITTVGMFASSQVSKWFKIDNNLYTIATFIIIGISLIMSIIVGVLQGYKEFVMLGVIGLSLPAAKMISLLVIRVADEHFKILIILIAIVIGSVFYLLLGYYYMQKKCGLRFTRQNSNSLDVAEQPSKHEYKGLIRYIVYAGLGSLCLALITNMDIIFIKSYFSGFDSGLYSSAMTFGRVLLYIPNALVLVMFPLIAESSVKNEKSLKVLLKTLAYSMLLMGLAFAIFWIFSDKLIILLYGIKYSDATQYIFWSMVNIIPISLITILTNYCLAKNEVKFFLGSIIVTVLLDIMLSIAKHDNINTMLIIMSSINFICFALNMVKIILSDKNKNESVSAS